MVEKPKLRCPLCVENFRTKGGVIEHFLTAHTDVNLAEALADVALVDGKKRMTPEEEQDSWIQESKCNCENTPVDMGDWVEKVPVKSKSRSRGPQPIGKPLILSLEQVKQIQTLRKDGAQIAPLAKRFNVSEKTVSYWTNAKRRENVRRYQREYQRNMFRPEKCKSA